MNEPISLNPDALYTRHETAKFLRVTARSLWDMERTNRIDLPRLQFGRTVRYLGRDIMRAIESSRVECPGKRRSP